MAPVGRQSHLATRAGLALGAGAVLVLAAAAASAGGAGDDKQAASPAAVAAQEKLVGVWKLNPELSEDPRAKMRADGGSGGGGGGGWGSGHGGGGGWGGHGGGGGGGGWGGHGGGGGGGGGWGGHGGNGERPSGGGAPGEVSFVRPIAFNPQLTVTNLTPDITMIDPDGGIRRLHADNKAYKDESGLEVKTRWEEAGLEVETKTARGKVKETWSVTGEPRRLTVLVRMDRPYGGEVTIKRVFDLSAPDAPRSEAP
jgi:hypothetical protein